MGKRIIVAITLLTLLISTWLYAYYDVNQWEIDLKPDFSLASFEKDAFLTYVDTYSVTLSLDQDIQMVGGAMPYFAIIEGQSISAGLPHAVLIGDEKAGELFRNHDIVGQTIDLLGKEYMIAGVVKNDNHLWLAYDESLETMANSGRITLWFKTDKNTSGKKDYLSLYASRIVFYKDMLFWWRLVPLVILLTLMVSYLLKEFEKIRYYGWQGMYKNYKRGDFKVLQLKALGMIVLKIMGLFLALGFVIKHIYVPSQWIATNVLSLSKWVEMIKTNALVFNGWLDFGFPGIVKIQFFYVFLLMISLLLSLYFYQKIDSKIRH